MSVLFVVTTFLPRAFDVDDKAADVAVAVTVTDVCVARRPITCAPTSIRYLTNMIMDPINYGNNNKQ